MLKQLSIVLLSAASSMAAAGGTVLEADSAAAIAARTRADFPYTVDEFLALARQDFPTLTRDELDEYIAHKYVETRSFGDTVRVFRKALRNMQLLNPATNPNRALRGSGASAARISYVDSVLRWREGKIADGGAHRVKYRFSIDVPITEELAGDSLRVWMPVPHPSQRQQDIEILSSSPADYILSDGRSPHSTIFFTSAAGAAGDTAHFEYTVSFVTKGEYFPAKEIAAAIRPYNTDSELYSRYTAFEAPHIVRLDSLAAAIAQGETEPFALSEKVYDYIINRYPWAGAREYSTIECIPEYVVSEGHGDCGQVALLYISLMRTLGIPARWESGWMLHPGEKNLHDWAEVYFEGVGWVPVDVSFGRYTGATDAEITGFYSHGMDSHRLAANYGVCGEFYPAKKYVRSETVDAQMGEVETTRGNLFYPGWSQRLELLEVSPVEADQWALVTIPVASMRTRGAHAGEMSTQAIMGMPLRLLGKQGEWYRAQTPEGYVAWVPESSVALKTGAEMQAWRANEGRLVVTSLDKVRMWKSPKAQTVREISSDLVLGSIVERIPGSKPRNGRVKVSLPDGRTGWIAQSDVTPIHTWASQPFDADKILDTAYSLEGEPYLWGGTSNKSVDCSGLVKVSYLNNGIILRRDASQQALTGLRLEADAWRTYEPADLLFFGNSSTGRVTHVGIYDHDGRYVHSSGRVKRNSLDPESPDYLYSPLHSVRIAGYEGTDGITRAINHPWYFITSQTTL